MNAFFGLASFNVDDVSVTHNAVRCDVSLITKPACPKCQSHTRVTLHGKGSAFRVHDTPSRGKPTVLHINRRRFRCEGCAGRPTFSERGNDIDERWKATRRLVQYVENEVTNHPLAHVARTTGLPETAVRNIALDLAARLEEGHRFPTPKVLASDGLTIKNTDYTVFAEAWTGRPIGLIETQLVAPARKWIENHIDYRDVQFFVTDLHKTNVSLGKKPFGGGLHVADKWHVVRRYQKPLGRVIAQELDKLRKAGQAALATELHALKPALLAVDRRKRKTRRKRGSKQLTLTFDAFLNVFKKVPRVRRAYWARYELTAFYSCTNEVDARGRLNALRRRLGEFHDLEEVQAFLKFLDEHQVQIFNYFQALRPARGGGFQGPTTNALEQRNSSIRQAWRASRGLRSLSLLRLRVVYGPWVMGSEIVGCAHPTCSTFVGPLHGPPCPPDLQAASGIAPRCSEHAI